MGTNEKDMTAGSPGKLIITFMSVELSPAVDELFLIS